MQQSIQEQSLEANCIHPRILHNCSEIRTECRVVKEFSFCITMARALELSLQYTSFNANIMNDTEQCSTAQFNHPKK
ncbi:hypothetical protein CEXT_706141 [Caerostris extrusa]|uniref:Uncharacterized protein n=1 Tax=Caerostris extrusa TaxID=172846 RepID=A0AAV4XCK0_CAEEX|nr:hypothetical protein CEXT_706141 [Caerostris extrusa]